MAVPATEAEPAVIVPNCSDKTGWDEINCISDAEIRTRERNGRLGTPAKDYWREAENDEYNICIRDRGLTR